MTKKMLIDATHPEETRVAVISGNRLEEYDFETIVRKQLKGNIYLVKVTRVEPSLQAAFVDFGGNRHGFLPFPEIHPDYYRIPIADREALLAEERALAAAEAAREDAEDAAELAASGVSLDDLDDDDEEETEEKDGADVEAAEGVREGGEEAYMPKHTGSLAAEIEHAATVVSVSAEEDAAPEEAEEEAEEEPAYEAAPVVSDESQPEEGEEADAEDEEEESEVETIGGDVVEAPVFRSSIKRSYKIQEVIKRNQIMLIQISKEERGNKGAAVTSYISLPGRYCVLMPNSPRGGGVSRKVSNVKDRQRLRKILQELNVPEGMSVILRTAGVARSKAEIKRDLDYLLRLWDQIRDLTLRSTAPALIYEEGNLIKRAIRDLYRRDIDEVHVAGEEAYKNAREFMRTLMPSHVERVQQYTEENMPLFFRYQVESQIDAIHSPTMHLKSGGYIVINPTEALVSIDVNSGRATKGRHIEETALKTNIEAAEEIARQLRLRDLGGLVVIDFIDMEDRRNNRIVERKLRDAMASDRARIQLGRISAFGLLELSRQRLHPSLVESNFEVCKHCGGTGLTRTVETAGVMILRAIEEEGIRGRAAEIRVSMPSELALFIFNNKREMLSSIERRYNIRIFVHADDEMIKPNYAIEVLRASGEKKDTRPQRLAPVKSVDISDFPELPEDETSGFISQEEEAFPESDIDEERPSRDRHERGGRDRNRRGGRRERGPRRERSESQGQRPAQGAAASQQGMAEQPVEGGESSGEGDAGRRRGRRGGRRRGGRNRGDRPQREGGAAQQPPGSGEQPSILAIEAPEYSQRPDRAVAASAAAAPKPANQGGGEPEQREGQGGDSNRKGWWKRLTE